jgi:hypothetical protein
VVVGRRWRCRSNHAVAVAGAERIVQVGLAPQTGRTALGPRPARRSTGAQRRAVQTCLELLTLSVRRQP